LAVLAFNFPIHALAKAGPVKDAAEPQAEQVVEDGDEEAVEDVSAEEAKDIELQASDKNKNKKTIIKTIRKSDSLGGILKSQGFSAENVYDVLAHPTWPRHYVLVPGSRYLVSTYTDKPLVEFDFFIPRSQQVVRVSKESEVKVELTDIQTDVKVRSVSGEVTGGLFGSIRQGVGDPWVAMRFMDAYNLDYKLDKQVRRGAKYSVTYEVKIINGQFVAPGELLYTSIEIDGKKEERFFLQGNETGVFMSLNSDHDLRPFFAPVEYLHVSSPFNPKRFHPIRRRRIPHKGVDLALAHGSSVLAALQGKVIRVGRNKAAGQFVVIAHPNGYNTEYVHLSAIESHINIGVDVKAGERLGSVGCTGYCTRPHLHFGISKDGEHYDPVRYLKPYTAIQEPKVQEFVKCVNNSKNPSACGAQVNHEIRAPAS
jgi:murein DD-endopeptidase MepM/ murein hydrolase activator NlpD